MLSLPILFTTLLSASSLASAKDHMEVKRASRHHQKEAERSLDHLLSLNTEAGELEARASDPCPADHVNWEDRNGATWWKVDSSQQDHARFHAYLSMASYGDYKTECAKTWPGDFEVLGEFSAPGPRLGQDGYLAKIVSMDKVVLVFKGNPLESVDLTPVSIEDIVDDCKGCTAAKGVYDLYMQAKKATNGFQDYIDAVNRTGLKSSVTGHGVAGGVAILAGLDLGSKGQIEYGHNQGTPRLVNYKAMYRYDRILQGEAAQSLIAKNDYMANAVPAGPFCHVGQKAHLTGDKNEWWTNCYGWNENATCLGTANSQADHTYYFTPIGQCGSVDKGF